MLRRAKKLCATEQSKRRRPQCVGFSRCHLTADLMKRFFAGACRVGDEARTAKRPYVSTKRDRFRDYRESLLDKRKYLLTTKWFISLRAPTEHENGSIPLHLT